MAFLLIDRSASTDVTSNESNSIAVLPFADMSADGDQEYFSDGLSEELLNVLAKIPDLKVAGRTSSFAFKDDNRDLREIGTSLNVSHILEGSVRKQENRVRITAQLIRAGDGFHMWSDTFDRELSDIFVVQEEIANSIVKNLALSMDLTLTSTLITTRTDNMRSYDGLLESRDLISKRGKNNLLKAIDILSEVTTVDPNYAAAWGMLAQAHTLSHYYNAEIVTDALYYGEEAARRALLIDPTLSIAHSALGDVYKDKNQWKKALDEYELALTTDQQNPETLIQYSQIYQRTGLYSKGLLLAHKARMLDPNGPANNLVEGHLLYRLGDKDEALKLFDNAIELFENSSPTPIGAKLLATMEDAKIEDISKLLNRMLLYNLDEQAPFFNQHLIGLLNDKVGMISYLNKVFEYYKTNPENINSENQTSGLTYAALATKFGDTGLGADLLELSLNISINNRNLDDLAHLWHPIFAPLLNDFGVKQKLMHFGFIQFWEQEQWSDFCKPVGDDFECY